MNNQPNEKSAFIKALWDASVEARKSPEWRKHTSGPFYSVTFQDERVTRSVTVEDIFFPDVPIAALFGDKKQQRKSSEEMPRLPILPAVVEPLKPKATTARVDDGTREVKFQNQFGEEIGSFRFRPADIGLADRYKKVAEVLPILNGTLDELSTDDGEEAYQKAKTTLYQLLDFMLDGSVSEGIFKKVSPFNPVGDEGKFFCEVVLDAIGNLIESEFAESLKRRREREKKLVKNPRVDLEKRMNVMLGKCERLLDVLTESLLSDAANEGGASV